MELWKLATLVRKHFGVDMWQSDSVTEIANLCIDVIWLEKYEQEKMKYAVMGAVAELFPTQE